MLRPRAVVLCFCALSSTSNLFLLGGTASSADRSHDLAIAPVAPNSVPICSTKPSVDLAQIASRHQVSALQRITIANWIDCVERSAATLEAQANTTSSGGSAFALRALRLQLQSAGDVIGVLSANSALQVQQGVTTGATTVQRQAVSTINWCNVFSAFQGATGTVTAASLNPNNGGQKTTYSIFNAALPVVGAIIACNAKATNTTTNNAATGKTPEVKQMYETLNSQ